MRNRSCEMKKIALFLGMCILLGSSISRGQEPVAAMPPPSTPNLKYRWAFIFGYQCNRDDVAKIKSLIDVSAEHGLNGIVLSSFGLDGITRWDEKRIALLKEVADYCAAKHLELIPTGFSVGYGGGALGHDRSFAAALPAKVLLKAKDGKIVPEHAENLLVNGDLEAHAGDKFTGYAFHDKPGVVSFADQTASSGKSSIRFEGFGSDEHGHGRIMQKVAVKPGRTYRFTFKLKTQDLQPVSSFQVAVRTQSGSLASARSDVKSTQDWTEGTLDFINKDETEVLVYAGVWEGKSGKFWLDDLKFSEYGDLSDIVRREGAPLTLRSRDRDLVFEEGRDFSAIRCLKHSEDIPIPPGSSIREGERLELSCYKIPSISHSWGKQISLCMSNPALYSYWEEQAKRLHEILGFKKILLSMDEIRNGGGCLSCQKRGLSMAEILGDCITRQHGIFGSSTVCGNFRGIS